MKKGFASIVCVDDADKYVIYVLDSVITARASSARGVLQEALECARQCGLCVRKSGDGTVTIEPDCYLNELDAWRDVAKCYVKCLVEQALNKTSREVSSESIDVAVSAAIGKLGWTYESSFPDLIASELFRYLWSSISKAVEDSVEKLEIDLDVTHGVNFMPTLSYQIVRYLATLLLIEKRNLNNVVIKVYNAVPVGTQQSAAGVRIFQYVEVFHESLNYIQIPHNIGGEVARAIELGAIPVIYEACRSGKSESEVDLRVEASIYYDNKTVTYRHSGSANFKQHISLAIKKAACLTATSRLKELMSHHLTEKLAPPARELLYGELEQLAHGLGRHVLPPNTWNLL